MGEFDDVNPKELGETAEQKRAAMQQERADAARKEREEATRRATERAVLLEEAENRTVELFSLLGAAFRGNKMSIDQKLVVERTGSRPDGIGQSRLDEKPAWIVIRADGTSLSPRHKPAIHFSPEYVLAARCGVKTKYELLVYPIERQDQTVSFATDSRDEFLKRIQDEVAGR